MAHRVLVVGGMDPTGGAGVWRDSWTLRAVDPLLEASVVVTALTRQGHGRPAQVRVVDPRRVVASIDAAAKVGRPLAIKLGLLPSASASAVGEALGRASWRDVPVVIDPVLRASDGGGLDASVDGYRALSGRASLWTPNGDEARALLGARPWRELAALLGGAVLLKGGHALADDPNGSDLEVCDRLLLTDGRVRAFVRPRVSGPDVRGTGCALASAAAAHLARGVDLESAVAQAIDWLDRTRRQALDDRWGQRSLPVS